MKIKHQNIQVLFVNEISQTATVSFLDTEVIMPVPLTILRYKIENGFYKPNAYVSIS
jgi:hypothetical protein